MALNLSGLSTATTAAVTLGNLILVSPQKTVGYQPQNDPSWKRNTAKQPPALLFNFSGEESAVLQSDITDHYIENNTAVQDQIALKPIRVSVQGFVGELNDIAPAALEPLKIAAEKLTVVQGYVPGLSTTALLLYANAFQLYQVGQSLLNSGISTWASINAALGGDQSGGVSVINGGGIVRQPNQTQQQIYFQQFYAYYRKRTLFTVQTPWAIFQDMAIESVKSNQNAETRVITDFEITFKQMRFASTQIVSNEPYDVNSAQGRKLSQGSKEVDNGTSTLSTSPVSFASKLG